MTGPDLMNEKIGPHGYTSGRETQRMLGGLGVLELQSDVCQASGRSLAIFRNGHAGSDTVWKRSDALFRRAASENGKCTHGNHTRESYSN